MMPTDSPNKDALRRKIAEVQGYIEVDGCEVSRVKHWHLPKPIAHPTSDLCFTSGFPNWPGDRNASYELLEKVKTKTAPAKYSIERDNVGFEPMSAYDESLLYLETEGWRWETCTNLCVDGLYQPYPEPSSAEPCPCGGQFGEWRKG